MLCPDRQAAFTPHSANASGDAAIADIMSLMMTPEGA